MAKCLVKDDSLFLYQSEEQAKVLVDAGYVIAEIDLTKADVSEDIKAAQSKQQKKVTPKKAEPSDSDAEYETKDMTAKVKTKKGA